MNYIRAENCGNLDFLNQPSNYQEKLRCHAHDGRTEEDGKWKIEQCSVGPETAIIFAKVEMIYTYGCDCAQFKVP